MKRGSDVSLSIGDTLRPITLTGTGAQLVAMKLLESCGWRVGTDVGLKVGGREPRPVTPESMTATMRQLQQAGVNVTIEKWGRQALWGPWVKATPETPAVPDGGSTQGARRFVKEVAAAPVVRAPAIRGSDLRKARASERDAMQAQKDNGVITSILFEDPAEQLRYEVRHLYLHTTLPTDRARFPLGEYDLMASFMADIEADTVLSRQQVLSAIIDVVTGRAAHVNSRRVRPKREGGGEEHRPPVVRGYDGATAWRANVTNGTPAARRIMWWTQPDGVVQLCRMALHDDTAMPER